MLGTFGQPDFGDEFVKITNDLSKSALASTINSQVAPYAGLAYIAFIRIGSKFSSMIRRVSVFPLAKMSASTQATVTTFLILAVYVTRIFQLPTRRAEQVKTRYRGRFVFSQNLSNVVS